MLRYNVDNEILMDIYQNYRMMERKSLHTFHQLGNYYLPIGQKCQVSEKTEMILKKLVSIRNPEEAEELENKLIHGYLTAKSDLRAEEADYAAFISAFDPQTGKSLDGLLEHVVGKKVIPYKIKNKCLHIDVIDTPAMIMNLDFENVLIADGRHPKEILMTHLSGDLQVREGAEDDLTMGRPLYRIDFVNGLTDEPYQTKISSFVFDRVTGSTNLYNYAGFRFPVSVDADKLPWRLLFQAFDAVIAKIRVLGLDCLNAREMENLTMICVFYELIRFYLEEETVVAAAKSQIRFNPETAEFAFSREDVKSVCDVLIDNGLSDLADHLHASFDDLPDFCLYWILYASTKKSEDLYKMLTAMIHSCAAGYKSHPLPLTCRKYHVVVRRKLNDYFSSHKWEGEFPFFRKKIEPQFLETSSVYTKTYTYINEKRKAYYVDFIEATTDKEYVVTAVLGFVLLQNKEDERDFWAMRNYFTDGGRRNARIMGQVVIDPSMNSFDVDNALGELIRDTMKEVHIAE